MIFVITVFGLTVGSFLNVVIDRLPETQSLLGPPSHCPACSKRLAVIDLIPLISYLWLRGKCRYCSAHIPLRILLIELITGGVFASIWTVYGWDPKMAFLIAYICLFLVIFVIDLERGLILNRLVYPAAIITLAIVPFRTELTITDSLIGGGVGLTILLIPALISRGGMGFGDVKMAGLMGLIVGFPIVFVALFLGIVSGGLIALFLIAVRLKTRKDAIPLGPFLSLGLVIALLWGAGIYSWYNDFLV